MGGRTGHAPGIKPLIIQASSGSLAVFSRTGTAAVTASPLPPAKAQVLDLEATLGFARNFSTRATARLRSG
jgi:hypothetical protein